MKHNQHFLKLWIAAAEMPRPAPSTPNQTHAFPFHSFSQMASKQDASAFCNPVYLQRARLIEPKVGKLRSKHTQLSV